MIRAVVQKGIIRPVDPLPADWEEGRVVAVDDLAEDFADGRDDFETWSNDMKTLTAELNDPEEWRAIEASLAEADRQSKDLVRREMGLS